LCEYLRVQSAVAGIAGRVGAGKDRPVPRTLLIHAGQFKTGTSFVQAALARSVPALRAAGIWYPDYGTLAAAARGRITSGNGGLVLYQEPEALIEELLTDPDPCDRLLLSNEFFCRELFSDVVQARLEAVRAALDITRVEVLLFIRNPVDHAASECQQQIKRSGAMFDVAEYFDRYVIPEQIAELLRQVAARPDHGVTVYNYSRVSDRLVPLFEDWLGLPAGALSLPEIARINRSLSRSELALVRALNATAAEARVFADALCEQLPEVAAELVYPPVAVQEAMLERLGPALEHVNAHVPADQRYDTAPVVPAAPETGDYSFDAVQLATIAETVGTLLDRQGRALAQTQAALDRERAVSAHHVGVARLLQGKRAEAAGYFDKALALNPTYTPSLVAVTRMSLEEKASAAEVMRTLGPLLENVPDLPETQRLKSVFEDRFGPVP
jgi:tetratricopeptide (TPR) repeat protein